MKTNFDYAIQKYSKQGLSDADCLVKSFYDYLLTGPVEFADKSMDDVSLSEFSGWLCSEHEDDERLNENTKVTLTYGQLKRLVNSSISESTMRKFEFRVSDYEHRGDLMIAINRLKEICPQAENFQSWEEHDYEKERERGGYESVYQGYVSCEVPARSARKLEKLHGRI